MIKKKTITVPLWWVVTGLVVVALVFGFVGGKLYAEHHDAQIGLPKYPLPICNCPNMPVGQTQYACRC